MTSLVAHLAGRVAARLVVPLGIAATLVVIGCAAVVLAARPDAPARVMTAAPEATWEVLRSSYAEISVPPRSEGWTVPGGTLFYADGHGRPVVGVTGPAVLDDGYCPGVGSAAPSNRAFVGLTPPLAGTGLRPAHRRLVMRWTAGIAGDPLRSRRTTTRLADGAPAAVSRTTIRLGDRDPCTPSRVELHVVSTVTRAGVVSAVLVRDLGPRSATDPTVRRILASLRVLR
ncbi:hypothetical protein NPS01_02630 [Nocardioides psychrotolerans]|uniref:DUF8017 domain-containing protein n=1 Tax=Nocardioides psychrotolerans TaxID=1005945 RepID=A0A1I3BJK8_9ACTN|nr:hypothetical protein [Nocardioides psychrotolerans]GEP36600.1 hypothetical protein NPS01_02630 [Nocardioides psychrotolerans]SFH62495.1 hypothetical protein SAMN05216561_101176 [Nocardioides psychrotolerans]